MMVTEGDQMICYDWNVDNIVHEWDASTLETTQQGAISCIHVDQPVTDYGQQKFEALPTTMGAKVAMLGTESGDITLFKHKIQ